MLKRLYIENFALVEKLEIGFKPGMNVLTGETGAGKSVIVGAISQALGEKADRDDIRSGTKLAVIEADFDIGGKSKVQSALNHCDINADGKSITLRREIFPARSSKCFINSQLVTLTQLRTVTVHLAELFGQHSHQQLLDEKNHQAFLDQFAGIGGKVEKLRELYERWMKTRKNLERLIDQKDQKLRERELMVFQKEEIERASISVGEEENLIGEKRILDSSRLLGEKGTLILDILEGTDNSVINALGACQKELSRMAELDKTLEKQQELLSGVVVGLEEFRSEIEAYRSSIPDDPDRLEEINQRLDEIYRLKKKYGGSEEAILTTLEKINSLLEATYDIKRRINLLKMDEQELSDKYSTLALEIGKKRHSAAKRLSGCIRKELAYLSMKSALFQYDFIYEDDPGGIKLGDRFVRPGPDGLETGRFLISANPGEPPKPLAKIASGGEISRIMLALKAVNTNSAKPARTLLVFDEIDSGIGGATAGAVADRLAGLSNDFQLLVITHLHQIALRGDCHYAVEKARIPKKGRNVITIKRLSESEKTKEIERMLALPENIIS